MQFSRKMLDLLIRDLMLLESVSEASNRNKEDIIRTSLELSFCQVGVCMATPLVVVTHDSRELLVLCDHGKIADNEIIKEDPSDVCHD